MERFEAKREWSGREMTDGLCGGIIHVVKEGDTLYKIAKMYHVEVEQLMYENPYVNIYQLQPGDEICVPVAAITQIIKTL